MHAQAIHIFVPYIGSFGGVEKLVTTLLEYLRLHGCKCRLLCFGNILDFSAITGDSVDVCVLGPRRNFFSEVASLRQYLHQVGNTIRGRILVFDLKSAGYFAVSGYNRYILHVDDPPSLLPTDISKHAWSALSKVASSDALPEVGFLIRMRAEFVHRLIARGVRRAAYTVVTTGRTATELDLLYGIKCSVINLGVRLRIPPASAESRPIDPFNLLSVCRLEKNKRIDWILDALGFLEGGAMPLSAKVNWRLRVVGKGDEMANLKAKCESLGLSDRVTFTGFATDEELLVMYQQACLFLMPAEQGFGIPALEALERGVPVVLNRDSRVSEALSGSPWVEIVEGGAEAFAAAMRRLIHRIVKNREELGNLPQLKSEDRWCEEIAELCGWF